MTRVNRCISLAAVGCLLTLVSCSSAPATGPSADGTSTTAAASAPTPPATPVQTATTSEFPPPAPPAAEEARRISLEDAKKALDSGRAVMVDVRVDQQWMVEHVKGTLHIPEGSIGVRMNELPKDKLIITYCS